MPQITLKQTQVKALSALCKASGETKFFVAKDQGAYIGANSAGKSLVYYFAGCNPEKDADWYDNAHDKFGGDDFGELFSAELLHQVAASDATKLVCSVTPNAISFKAYS